MEGQSIMANRKSEIVIDIEPFVKEEPNEDEVENSERNDYYEGYEEDCDDFDGDESKFEEEDGENEEASGDEVKEEPGEAEREETKERKAELQNTPSTCHNDTTVYFEIPIIDSGCKCVVCGSMFVSSGKGHTSEYICTPCLTKKHFPPEAAVPPTTPTASTSRNSSQHIKVVHPNTPIPIKQVEVVGLNKSYMCNLCQKGCVSVADLSKHMLTHNGERPYPCDSCPKKFNQLSNLMRHKATHSNAKPFQCPICSKTFNQASYLKKHNLTHSGEKPYGCVVCEKRFSDYSTLAKHKLIHSGERPFVCSICSKTFNQLASLRRHEVIHRDEKPFMCDICNKKFAQTHHLKRHQKVHKAKFVNMASSKFKMAPIPIVDKTHSYLANRRETGQESDEIVFESCSDVYDDSKPIFNLGQEFNSETTSCGPGADYESFDDSTRGVEHLDHSNNYVSDNIR